MLGGASPILTARSILTGEPVKYARALLVTAFAFGAAMVIQVATSPAASAQQDTALCTSCWFVHTD